MTSCDSFFSATPGEPISTPSYPCFPHMSFLVVFEVERTPCRWDIVQAPPRLLSCRPKKTQSQMGTQTDTKAQTTWQEKKKRQSWINVTAQGGWIHDYHPVSLPYLMLLSGDTKSTLYFRQPFAAVSFTAHAFTNAHLIMLLVKTKCYAHLFCGKMGFFLLQWQ